MLGVAEPSFAESTAGSSQKLDQGSYISAIIRQKQYKMQVCDYSAPNTSAHLPQAAYACAAVCAK
jgi:hypothetical protein